MLINLVREDTDSELNKLIEVAKKLF